MSDASLAFLVARLTRGPISRRTRRSSRRTAGRSAICTSSSAASSAAGRTTCRPTLTGRSARASSSRSARSPRAARRPRSSPRCRTRRAVCSSRGSTSSNCASASPEFERYCTQAITETLRQSLESLYGQYSQRAAEQQTLTRTLARADPQSSGRLRRDRALARGRAADGGCQGAHDHRARSATAPPSGCSRWSTCCGASCLPDARSTRRSRDVMTAPLVTLPASATAAEGMHVMAARGVRQIAVVDNGRLAGVINERDLFALQRVSMRAGQRGAARRRHHRQAEGSRRRHPPAHAEPAGARRRRRAADPHDRLAQRCLVAPRDRDRRSSGTTWPTSTGAGWRSAAKAAASRRSPPTRTTRCCSPPATSATPRNGRRGSSPSRARSTPASTGLGFPLCTGNVMAGNPGALPVDRGVEGQVPGLDPPADAAGAAQREHRVRLPAALRRS